MKNSCMACSDCTPATFVRHRSNLTRCRFSAILSRSDSADFPAVAEVDDNKSPPRIQGIRLTPSLESPLSHRNPSLIRTSVATMLPIVFSMGCGNQIPSPGTGNARPAGRDFATAPLLDLDADGNASMSGNVTQTKMDVWDIGPVNPGDHVLLDVVPAAG